MFDEICLFVFYKAYKNGGCMRSKLGPGFERKKQLFKFVLEIFGFFMKNHGLFDCLFWEVRHNFKIDF